MTHNQLLVIRKSPQATLPVRGSEGAAGYDLSSAKEMVIPGRGKGLVPTDLVIAVPDGTYGRIAPRSGLAWKNHIDVGAGVIDGDYRGPVGVVLFNHSDVDFKIAVGDRIAQLILEQIKIVPVKEVEAIEETSRGEGGFGSTGVSTAVKMEEEKREKSIGPLEGEKKATKKDISGRGCIHCGEPMGTPQKDPTHVHEDYEGNRDSQMKDVSEEVNPALISTMKRIVDSLPHRMDIPIVKAVDKYVGENSHPQEGKQSPMKITTIQETRPVFEVETVEREGEKPEYIVKVSPTLKEVVTITKME